MIRILVIPDVQAKPGVNFDHLTHIGRYIVDKQPDIIVNIGDFADMESLCSYDKGKKDFEGRRYKKDIQAAHTAMDMLLAPMREYNQKALEGHRKRYKPRMVLTLGNHEERIQRVAQYSPELDGLVSYDDLPYKEWEVHDYLKPVVINGVLFVHYLANPMSGKPYGGSAANMLQKVGQSYFMGHKQTLDIATRFTVGGVQQWGIVCGACYTHHENYKGYQGNDHFRGVIMLNRVQEGSYDPTIVSLDYLAERYGDDRL